ncbi:MAG: hypothetical protein WDM94_01240 [Bauldia sp.]
MSDDQPQYRIEVNGKAFLISQAVVEGLQVRVLGQLEPQVDLIVEGSGNEPDRIVQDRDRIALQPDGSPTRFFAKPPTSFG